MSALVSCIHLVKEFPGPAAVLGRATTVRAVQHVSLAVSRGETLALVGESGSGKTTLGRCLVRLTEPTSGSVSFNGTDVLALAPGELRRWRRRAQFVFQDPAAALNPRMSIGAAMREPLVAHGLARGAEAAERVASALTEVGLDPSHAARLPHELSGGQKQRAVIARALILEPEFVVLDEPVASLDVSVAAQVLNLLADLRERHRLTYLLIAHDLRVVRHFADRVAVMYAGRLVEVAPTELLYADPRHPYTAALLSAVPALDPGVRGKRVPLPGDPPSGRLSLPGCPFEPRCQHPRKDERCVRERPLLREVPAARLAACHYADDPAAGRRTS
ncbi:MAG TPA: oligopeptide/dipeptide ABC transporter ATP-binding protein [Gemmatimonadales bacterium]|nr:oligopeptide/dipeptide ABC transporter ATP-binding protein [Gemmatimonadales bacterium]